MGKLLLPRRATAQSFMRGFLGNKGSTIGTVITVNSTGNSLALFGPLALSDLYPSFVDGNGGTYGNNLTLSLLISLGSMLKKNSNTSVIHLSVTHHHYA